MSIPPNAELVTTPASDPLGRDPNGEPRGAPATRADPGLQKTLRAFADLSYRDAFWPVRVYEDACDRLALRALMPAVGVRVIEVGAGFGRLAGEYRGYREVVLLDASETMLQAARERLEGDDRYQFVSGDAFSLPFPDATFDTAVCIRVLHHFQDPRPAIRELARVLRPDGVLVLESANKRNLKAIAAYLMRRHERSPFTRGSERNDGVYLLPDVIRRRRPSARSDELRSKPQWRSPGTDFDHAPADVRTWLRSAGFRVETTRTASIFRLPVVSRRVPPGILAALERPLQSRLASVTPGPSLFFRAIRESSGRGTR